MPNLLNFFQSLNFFKKIVKKNQEKKTPAQKPFYRPVTLLILDGFGVNVSVPESTWRYAKRPSFEELEKYWPFTALQASGIAVGLPWNEPGNSEVGHLTIGAGRALYHHLPRIISAISDGSFFKNEAFKVAAERAKEPGQSLHLMGLFSSGSVHAYAEHLYALMDLAKKEKISEVWLHLFSDGKDAPPKEFYDFLGKFAEKLKDYPKVRISSLLGRSFAMDRDENWDKIKITYRLLTEGRGQPFKDPLVHVEESYRMGKNDADLLPGFLADENNRPLGRIKDGDAVIFYNFREDSARELTSAFISEQFDRFGRESWLKNLLFVTMTEYDKRFSVKAAFPSLDVERPLARVVSEAGLKQLHIAETDKYAHITYFLNGGREKPFSGEDRILIPSLPAESYDQRPEMSARQITEAVIKNLENYDFIAVNFANGDMVGHTGNFEATVKAIEVLDFSVGKIIAKALEVGGAVLIIADHGNAEEKRYRLTGEERTQHTINPVPCYLAAPGFKRTSSRAAEEISGHYRKIGGVLIDVAPTVLNLLGLKAPPEMNGENLLDKTLK
ncbi:MAG: 2,3-bisphosphoglycerate-independent phosphoglycerate mutase [Candidatus Niyogibacteria bacterium]|nr:2,3-bisphosphoglycerate-independent phosphoglycerate mutase [Candidatus Niyogibacteria bacterium]